MTNTPFIRPGTPADQLRADRLYALAKEGLKAAGIDQWQGPYPNGSDFLRDVQDGRAIAIESDGTVIGVAAAYIGHEPTYDRIWDGSWLTDNSQYGIIHRITVDPSLRNTGAASAVISLLAAQCLEKGISSMRCDTHRDNLIMQRTLEKNGFCKCGTIAVEDGSLRFAYEKLL